jgi:hypothetical protein
MTSYLYQRLGRQLFELAEVVMTTAATAKLSACISRLNFPWLVPYYICFNLSREEMTKRNLNNVKQKLNNPYPKSKSPPDLFRHPRLSLSLTTVITFQQIPFSTKHDMNKIPI